ncbi:pyridoxamine kinase [uncultured Granulicatella sp.]|uniref:pyridoxamine kinase n=1 Tax=uncultured Granulicatella sp. TaxID=316089 RepID=UPI0026298159|nr:pyridoxamine kinase [uncultured Granulicatella sp.]
MKKILIANDLPGIGKVALAPAIPIFACCQIETILLPTVLLSSHTGGFKNIAIAEQTEFMRQSLCQWENLELNPDAILTGYFRNTEQIELMVDTIEKLPESTKIFVDPIMGDNGKLYSGFTAEHVDAIRKLIQHADVMYPNITEACLLTETAYPTGKITMDFTRELAKKLAELGPEYIIITGCPDSEELTGVQLYTKETDSFFDFYKTKYPHHFYGTGDTLAALTTACILQDMPLEKALSFTLKFIDEVLQLSSQQPERIPFGLPIEKKLGMLTTKFTTEVSL